MMTKKVATKIFTLPLIIMIILSLSGCGTKHEAVKQDKDPKKTVVDRNYTNDFKKEKGVQAGQVYVQNGVAIATIIVKNDVSDSDAKALATKYSKDLKNTYKGMKVNVQVIKNGKNIVNMN